MDRAHEPVAIPEQCSDGRNAGLSDENRGRCCLLVVLKDQVLTQLGKVEPLVKAAIVAIATDVVDAVRVKVAANNQVEE